MTLSYTALYEDWIEILVEDGVGRPTAQQIIDITVGDPRTVWAPARTDTEVAQLRAKLEEAFDELDLTAFGEIDDHTDTRKTLLSAYDEAFEAESRADPKTESEQYDDDSDSIYVEVEETDIGLTGAAAAGAAGDPDGQDITPRETPLTDDEIWGEEADTDASDASQDTEETKQTTSPPESNLDSESAANADSSSTDTNDGETDASDATDDGEENEDEETPFLPSVMADIVLQNDSQEFEDALEPPLKIVAEEFFQFGTRSAAIYRMFVRDALFPQYETEEAEELFENLVESRIHARLQQLEEQPNEGEQDPDDPESSEISGTEDAASNDETEEPSDE
jgi:hypothetical protein